jgi:uncharacterized protein YrrD
MEVNRPAQSIQGFQVISITNGEVIGKVEDVLIDLKKRHVAAIVTSKGSLLRRKVTAISREAVQVWGQDVILVTGPDVIQSGEKMQGFAEWESAGSQVKGKNVLSAKGERVGELKDVIIDNDAMVVGYALSKVLIEGPVQESKRIHANATQTLGADALIVDTTKLYDWNM